MFIYWSFDPHQFLRIQRSCLVIFQIFKTFRSVSFFLNRNMIKFANIFHKFVSFIREENDMWKIFHYKLGIFKDNFFECEKKLYFKNSRSDSTTCMNQNIKCEHVWHMITLVFWFWEVFFFKCYFFFLSYTFFRAPESLGWLGQHFNKFDCPLPRMLCDKFNWNW